MACDEASGLLTTPLFNDWAITKAVTFLVRPLASMSNSVSDWLQWIEGGCNQMPLLSRMEHRPLLSTLKHSIEGEEKFPVLLRRGVLWAK